MERFASDAKRSTEKYMDFFKKNPVVFVAAIVAVIFLVAIVSG